MKSVAKMPCGDGAPVAARVWRIHSSMMNGLYGSFLPARSRSVSHSLTRLVGINPSTRNLEIPKSPRKKRLTWGLLCAPEFHWLVAAFCNWYWGRDHGEPANLVPTVVRSMI